MDDEPLTVGKDYLVKIGTKTIAGIVAGIDYAIDVNTGEHINAETIGKNGIAVCEILLTEAVVADLFDEHRTLGELRAVLSRIEHRLSLKTLRQEAIFLKNSITIHRACQYLNINLLTRLILSVTKFRQRVKAINIRTALI